MRPAEARDHAEHLMLGGPHVGRVVDELIANRLDDDPALREWWDTMSDAQARIHEGDEHPLEAQHLRSGLRLCHAWRVVTLRARLGDRLASARTIDVGDVDGLMLKALGKEGLGFNLSEAAVQRIRSNGIEARGGDGHAMPFDDGSFDVVLCFETLEHVESPVALLDELGRICAPGGRVFVSVPWVASSRIYPRNPDLPRGHAHCFELNRGDLGALVSHSPLSVVWEDVCDLGGRPRTPSQMAVSGVARGARTVAGGFMRFQFLELAPDAPA